MELVGRIDRVGWAPYVALAVARAGQHVEFGFAPARFEDVKALADPEQWCRILLSRPAGSGHWRLMDLWPVPDPQTPRPPVPEAAP